MGRASEKRKARIRSLLMSTLAEIVREELSDPRLELFSIMDIELSSDLTVAQVKVSSVGGPAASAACVAALESATPLLWNRLRDATDLRFVPHLRFSVDQGPEYQAEIERLLLQVPPAAEDAPDNDDNDGGAAPGSRPD